MLSKHFAVLGSTGTGKSTSVALILHRISQLSPEGHIVMIDPHGEYSAAFKGCGELFNVDNLQLPYWLMNFEEHCEVLLTTSDAERQRDADILAKCLLAARTKGKNLEAYGKVTVDSPIPYLLTDLNAILTNEMGKLDRAGDTAPFQRLKTKLDELRADPRYTFMFSGMLVQDTMGSFLAKLFRLPSHGRPISIVDVSGVPSDITSVVVSVLARMVFDYAIWSRNEPQRPLLLVCEEAHRYVPKDDSAKGQAVRKILERIAKEGRKYGVSLGLITQRPSDLAEGVLSQCGTIISMRLNNDRDQACVRAAMPEGARGFLDAIPALAQPRMHRLRRRRRHPDPRPLRRPRARKAPRLVRPELRRTVARDRRRGRHHPAHRQALAGPRPLSRRQHQRCNSKQRPPSKAGTFVMSALSVQCYAACTEAAVLRRLIEKPTAPKPNSIMAQVEGSGTAAAEFKRDTIDAENIVGHAPELDRSEGHVRNEAEKVSRVVSCRERAGKQLSVDENVRTHRIVIEVHEVRSERECRSIERDEEARVTVRKHPGVGSSVDVGLA